MFGSHLTIRKTPTMADAEIDKETIVFIKNWEAMLDWSKYKALVFIDLDYIYFLVFSIKTEKLLNCYVGFYEDMWMIDHDKVRTWDRINNVVEILKIKDTMDLGGMWK